MKLCFRAVLLVLATIVSLTGLAAPTSAAQVRPLLQGVVVDQGGRFVDDVTVLAVRPDGTVAASALSYASERPDGPQHGYFFLAVGEAGRYTVALEKDGYADADLGSQRVSRRGVVSLGEVTLTRNLTSSATRLSVGDRSLTTGQRTSVEVTVTTAETARPTGEVVLYLDGRVLDRLALRANKSGVVGLRLPKLGKGEHTLRAKYSGATYVKQSKSATVDVVVRRQQRPVPARAWLPGQALLRLMP